MCFPFPKCQVKILSPRLALARGFFEVSEKRTSSALPCRPKSGLEIAVRGSKTGAQQNPKKHLPEMSDFLRMLVLYRQSVNLSCSGNQKQNRTNTNVSKSPWLISRPHLGGRSKKNENYTKPEKTPSGHSIGA